MTVSGNILLSTAYFPPVSYFVQMIRSKAVHIEQMETFPKQTYRNRCEIMTSSGKTSLVVPVTKPQGNHTQTKDIEICYREPWPQQHWKALQSGYHSSPYFAYYADIIQPIFECQDTLLAQNNYKILLSISGLIGIYSTIMFTQEYEKIPVGMLDLRSEISPKKLSTIIEFPEYPQVFRHKYGFAPNLSILDLLFNIGPEAGKYLEGIVIKEVVS